jgi:outer membrane lipoprotein-sorting protein
MKVKILLFSFLFVTVLALAGCNQMQTPTNEAEDVQKEEQVTEDEPLTGSRTSYKKEYRVSDGDRVYKEGDRSAYFDLMDKNKEIYRSGVRVRSALEYYPVSRDGYLGLIEGSVDIR